MLAKPSRAVLAAALVPLVPLPAQSTPPPIPPELRARFGFEGPLVVKIGDGIGNLQVADVDGDGRLEAVVVDARRARLVAVRVTGRDSTEQQPIPTAGQIGGFAVADVHGDGKPDLLLVDARGRMTIRHPGAEPRTLPLDLGLPGRGVQLLTGDLDGDRKADLVVIGGGRMRWITALATTPVLTPIEPLDENTRSVQLTDADGDGKLDLIAAAPGAMGLRVRAGDGRGAFGPWRMFAVEELRDLFPARTAAGAPALALITGAPKRVSLQQLGASDDAQALDWWPTGENAANKAFPWVLADVDADGDDDLVLARADRAQLCVYEWRDDTFVPRTLPTLAGVASLVAGDADGDGRNDLVLVSPEEDALAWIPGAGPLDRFPVQLPCVDKPVAATIDPTGGGVLVLGRNDKRDAHLHRVVVGKEPVKVADLGRLPADPVRLIVADIGDAPGLECAFVVPGEGLRTLTLGAEQKAGKPTETAGFTKKLDDGAVLLCRHGDRPALLAVRERFARTFRIDDKGQVQVLAQDNGPEGTSELALAADFAGGRYYFDKKANRLLRTAADRPPVAVDVPANDFQYLAAHRDGALLLGPRGVLRVPFVRGASLRSLAMHEPPVERTAYVTGRAADFDHDGVLDLAVVDRHLPGVQILAGGRDGLQRALAIPVFERPPSEHADHEPRELAAGDLDGDGRADFVLVAHDRILVYLQEP
jgi:hypothetical protein